MKKKKSIIRFVAGVGVMVLVLTGNFFMYKNEVASIEEDYKEKLNTLEKEMKEVYDTNLTVHNMTELEDANNIYKIAENFIYTFYTVDTNSDWEEIESILRKCMTTEAYEQYTPLASGSRGEKESPYTITVSDINVYLNYENYTSNSVSVTVFFNQKMETESIDGEEQPYIWNGTFIKENEDWKVDEILLNTLIQI